MTYPKVIAFLTPGPSCYSNIILLLSKWLPWLFLITIWLFCKVPCWPSGVHQLYPRYGKLHAGQQVTNNPWLWPAVEGPERGRRFWASSMSPRSRIFCSCRSLPSCPQAVHSSWWEMLFSMKHKATPSQSNTSHWSLQGMAGVSLLWLIGNITVSQGGGQVGTAPPKLLPKEAFWSQVWPSQVGAATRQCWSFLPAACYEGDTTPFCFQIHPSLVPLPHLLPQCEWVFIFFFSFVV